MKKTLIYLALALFGLNVQAQISVGKKQDVDHFLTTKTYIVLDKNPMLQYNQVIKETVEKYWKITPYEFVTLSNDEFEKVRFDSTKSFLILNKVVFEKDKVKVKYNVLSVLLGGNYELVRQMPELASVPLAYDESEEDTYIHKVAPLILFIQEHIKTTMANPKLTSKKSGKYYTKINAGLMQSKTLYLTQEDLSKTFKSANDIKAVYKADYKIVSRDELDALIAKQDPNAVFVHKVGPDGTKRKARCYKFVVDAANGKLYYAAMHQISDSKPEGLLKKDWQKMGKAKK